MRLFRTPCVNIRRYATSLFETPTRNMWFSVNGDGVWVFSSTSRARCLFTQNLDYVELRRMIMLMTISDGYNYVEVMGVSERPGGIRIWDEVYKSIQKITTGIKMCIVFAHLGIHYFFSPCGRHIGMPINTSYICEILYFFFIFKYFLCCRVSFSNCFRVFHKHVRRHGYPASDSAIRSRFIQLLLLLRVLYPTRA